VARISVREGRATGVVLESGEEIEAGAVLSSADVRRTFLDLVEAGQVDDRFAEEVLRFKFRGSSGKVNLALDGLPEFACLSNAATGGEHLRGAISFSPSVDYMEAAYDDAKYGRFSRRPYIDVVIPTLVDPSMAPPGKHVMSCFVQYAPYHLADGEPDWDAQRDAFGDAVVDTIEERVPGIRKLILHRQVVTPLDLERTFGLTEGNIFQGELSLEQLFWSRPVPGFARYRAPIRGLWLCGSSVHPGGGIMGAPGRMAALQVLRREARP
jgi:phytoene dehydrogenase-like protein